MSLRSDAIVVTYEPDTAALLRLVTTLAPQVGKITIVDNGSANLSQWRERLPASQVELIAQPVNAGIALALNQGSPPRTSGARPSSRCCSIRTARLPRTWSTA